METVDVAEGEGAGLYAPTGYDDRFCRGVRLARRLAWLTSSVELPPTIALPTDRPVIVAANHASMFDLFASLITVGHYGATARMGVHSRFFDRPVIGSFLAGIGCIPFSSAQAERAERTMVDALESGQLCCLMPEGRIIRPDQRIDGLVGQGRPGISRIARAAGAAILPVGFAGADRTWPSGRAVPRPRRGPVRATIGEPFLFESDDHIANADALMTTISALVARGQGRPQTGGA